MNVALAIRKANIPDPLPMARNTVFLSRLLLGSAFFNLFLVATIGVVLRAFPYLSHLPFSYKNLLHGHSHFAFGGWIMPCLIACVIKAFPEAVKQVGGRHLFAISVLTLLSAYGMLVTFTLQGYSPVSIVFSTLSIFAGYYFAAVMLNAIKKIESKISLLFLKAGIFYMLLSSVGPFATGPLIALGMTGTPVYYDAIYFYLHFQYNGLFVFAVLAIFYRFVENSGETQERRVFYLLNAACVPTYLLSVLWHQPSVWLNVAGGAGAMLQCIALYYFGKDLALVRMNNRLVKTAVLVSFTCFFLKTILQLLSAFPAIAELAYLQRPFVIAYLHLVLVGFISMFLIAYAIHSFKICTSRLLQAGVLSFIIAFVITECLLIANPLSMMLGYDFRYYTLVLLLCSILLPVSIGMIGIAFIRQLFPKLFKVSYNAVWNGNSRRRHPLA